MHRHFCSQCGAVVTLDDNRRCPNSSDHEDGLCETCALAQPADEEGDHRNAPTSCG
jgi:hypothetical protein